MERRRTRRLTWMKMVRSIRRRRLVVDGGEDVRPAPNEPTKKAMKPKKESSLPACLISVRPQSTPKSADLAEKEKLKNKTKLG